MSVILNSFKENGKLLVGVFGAVNAANVPSSAFEIKICNRDSSSLPN